MSKLPLFLNPPAAARHGGPVLTPTQRPGLLAALERALQRAQQRLGVAVV